MCSENLLQFGGHDLAAGMSIEESKIPDFKNAFEKIVSSNLKDTNELVIDADMEITKNELNVSLIRDIYVIKPYGQANPSPLFVYRGLKIHSIRTLKEDKHLKFTLKDGSTLIEALAFSQGIRRDEFKVGDKIDVLCSVEINTYNTPRTLQFVLQDFKKSIE